MTFFNNEFDQRTLLKGSGLALGAAAATTWPFGDAFAATFPERNMKIFVPTREGGGADRNLRTFSGV